MYKLYNDPSHKTLRQHLRNNASVYERALWNYLRGRQQNNKKFRRQHGVGRYILDFYCPSLRLAIEIDGPVHESVDSKAYDKEREAFLNGHKIHVLHFSNEELKNNLPQVLATINNHASASAVPPPRSPSCV